VLNQILILKSSSSTFRFSVSLLSQAKARLTSALEVLNLSLERIIRVDISTSGDTPSYQPRFFSAMAVSAAPAAERSDSTTPIARPDIQVQATVTVSAEFSSSKKKN
jgi:uncharacterized protein YggE